MRRKTTTSVKNEHRANLKNTRRTPPQEHRNQASAAASSSSAAPDEQSTIINGVYCRPATTYGLDYKQSFTCIHKDTRLTDQALKVYRTARQSGDSRDSPERAFPNDGTDDWFKCPDGLFRARYTDGPLDRAWMEERDRNYLARIAGQKKGSENPSKTSQTLNASSAVATSSSAASAVLSTVRYQPAITYGLNYYKSYATPGEVPPFADPRAVIRYKNTRKCGNVWDSPKRSFPQDGTYDWFKVSDCNYMHRYTEGPLDRAWMEERDRNYLARIAGDQKRSESSGCMQTESPQETTQQPAFAASSTAAASGSQLGMSTLSLNLFTKVISPSTKQDSSVAHETPTNQADTPIEFSSEFTEQISKELFCSITHELMTDPVVAADGFSYERTAIETWIQKHDKTALSPKTGERLAHLNLTPNHTLRIHIQDFCTHEKTFCQQLKNDAQAASINEPIDNLEPMDHLASMIVQENELVSLKMVIAINRIKVALLQRVLRFYLNSTALHKQTEELLLEKEQLQIQHKESHEKVLKDITLSCSNKEWQTVAELSQHGKELDHQLEQSVAELDEKLGELKASQALKCEVMIARVNRIQVLNSTLQTQDIELSTALIQREENATRLLSFFQAQRPSNMIDLQLTSSDTDFKSSDISGFSDPDFDLDDNKSAHFGSFGT
jgi:U-box domain